MSGRAFILLTNEEHACRSSRIGEGGANEQGKRQRVLHAKRLLDVRVRLTGWLPLRRAYARVAWINTGPMANVPNPNLG